MTRDPMEELDDCRERIDVIDLQLVDLLNERTKIVEQIGAIKRSLTLPIYEPNREVKVITNVLTRNTGPLSPESVRRIFERIMDEMRTLQKMKMMEAQKEMKHDAKA